MINEPPATTGALGSALGPRCCIVDRLVPLPIDRPDGPATGCMHLALAEDLDGEEGGKGEGYA